MTRKLLCAFWLLLLCNFVFAASSPVDMLQKTANQLVSELSHNRANLQNNPGLTAAIVARIVLPHIDQVRMARSVVTREAWLNANSAQQKQFIKEFRRLVVGTYASAFSSYTNERVQFSPLRDSASSRDVEVQSVIVRSGKPPIAVTYRLMLVGSQWKIYDFSVEGVSMVQSFRSQLASSSQPNLSDLIGKLQQHNARNI